MKKTVISPKTLNEMGALVEDAKSAAKLTRDQLVELEQKKKSKGQQIFDFIITLCPVFAWALALCEYLFMPDKQGFSNPNPERYVILLTVPAAIYLIFWLLSLIKYKAGNKKLYWKLLYKAPLYSVIFLFLSALDICTLKTGKLLYPFIPWVNDIINAGVSDWKNVVISSLFSLRLLFLGYFWGVFVGLITGIACGYSRKVHYWINPIIKVLGPIPTATWLPLIMLLFPSLFSGSVFVIALGTWFAVTVATITGIQNIDRSYFDAARILGAKGSQLIFRVAIPHAMPNILQGMTQGMSSACVTLMIAEMLGVEAGLGWYITWSKAWALYNRMFVAIVVLCIIFNFVTKALDRIKKYALRWQTGAIK